MMKRFFKWFKDNRPRVLYRFWLVLMFVNLGCALLLTWAHREYPKINVTTQVWYCSIMSVLCLGMSLLWRYYLENPEKYEELKKRGLRRPRRDSKDEDEKK